MKKRLVKKQMKKVIGFNVNGVPVYNCVSNRDYNGGCTCEEDYFNFELKRIRKKYSRPLLLTNKWSRLYDKINNYGY